MHSRDIPFTYIAVSIALGTACATGSPPAAGSPSIASINIRDRLGPMQGEIDRTITSANESLAQLNQIEADLLKAELESDKNFFERIAADEFMFTDESGAINTKAETIAALDQPRGYTVKSSIVDHVTIKLFDGGAIVWGRKTIDGSDTSGRAVEVQLRFTHVFQRWSGQWHLTAAHQSLVPLTRAITRVIPIQRISRGDLPSTRTNARRIASAPPNPVAIAI